MADSGVEFTLPVYEGPLDLLLAMIQKEEVNIYDIPIASITDQFLDYLHKAEEVGLSDLSEFYKMAAELIYIKAQMMLPRENIEFDDDFADPREELVERLLEYSRFKRYSELLMGGGDAGDVIPARKDREFDPPFSDEELWENVSVQDLLKTYMRMLEDYSEEVEEEVYNVFESVTEKDKLALLNELLDTKETVMFTELFTKTPTRLHIICSFLALLEAVKDRMILVRQDQPFGDIAITRRVQDDDEDLEMEYDGSNEPE